MEVQFFPRLIFCHIFHQIELHPDCRDITTFLTHEGFIVRIEPRGKRSS